jgi:quercetin dioxygenase-like cupin family protein
MNGRQLPSGPVQINSSGRSGRRLSFGPRSLSLERLVEDLEAIRPEEHAVFAADKMGKATLFHSDRIMVGLNSFEPGQEHSLHAHSGMDKVYHVLSGKGRFLLEGREIPMEAGQMLIAPEGVAHGIRNDAEERLIVLAILAPSPG